MATRVLRETMQQTVHRRSRRRCAASAGAGSTGGSPWRPPTLRLGSLLLLLSLTAGFPPSAASAPIDPFELEVHIEGVSGEIEENVRLYLSIVRAAAADYVPPGRVEQLHRQAESEIRGALEPFGYYGPRVESELERDGDRWTARYRIDPGPAVRVEEADVNLEGPGIEMEPLRAQVGAFPLAPGDRFDHSVYETGKDLIYSVALEQGYLAAFWTEAWVEVDTSAHRARIRLRLETGPRFEFGEVRFRQVEDDEPPFTEDFLRRFVTFREGDPYRSAELLAFQDLLAGSAYFERVELAARPEEATELRVPIEVLVAPAPDLRYGVGGGYGTDTGVRATASLDWNRVNRHGHRLLGEGHASFLSRRVGARYVIPVGRHFGSRLSLAATYEGESFDENRSQVLRGLVAYDRDWRGLRQRFSVQAVQEWFEIGLREAERTFILPGVSLSRIIADAPVFATRGHRVLAEAQGSHEAIGSDIDFLQGRVEGRLVRSPWERGRVLARLELGATATADFGRLPLSVRFFAGGDRSVRGFGFRRLGPRAETGEPIGGRYLLTGSLEVEQRFRESWGAAAFVDFGNVWLELDDLPVELGAGVGGRWISPVGLVRLDLATQVGEPGLPLRVHLTLGPDL